MFQNSYLLAKSLCDSPEREKLLRSKSSCILILLLLGNMFVACSHFQLAKVGASSQAKAAQAPDTDWWPMFHHDSAHSGYSTSTAPNTNQTLWKYTTGSPMYSSPAVVGGIVYVGSEQDDKVYALSATTGALIWSYATNWIVTSSPALDGGIVYVGSWDDNVYALNATTGAPRWTYATGGKVDSSPAVVGGIVYVGSYDFNVYALNATTGALVWKHTTSGAVGSPAVFGGIVFVGSGDYIYALNATTGVLLWTYTTGGGVGSPTVVNGVVFVGSGDDNVYALNAATGTLLWKYKTGNAVYSSPAVAGGLVYVSSNDGYVYALNATTGAYVWSCATGGWVSSPAIAGSKVFIGSPDHRVYALNASTGAYVWSYKTGDQVVSSPAVAGGIVYVSSDDGNVYAFGTARVHNVNTGLSYPTIQAAIDAPQTLNGHTLMCDAGNYTENVNVYKALRIIGFGPLCRMIPTSGSNDTVSIDVTPRGAFKPELTNFTITAPLAHFAISLTGSNWTIDGNFILGAGSGIDVRESSNDVISGNVVNCTGDGMCLRDSSCNNTVADNQFLNDNYGVNVRNASNCNLLKGNFVNGSTFDGIRLNWEEAGFKNVAYNTITDNTVQNCNNGVFLDNPSTNNLVTENLLSNNRMYGLRIRQSNNSTITQNIIVSNSQYGAYVESSNNNLIFDNRFINAHNAWDNGADSWNITKTYTMYNPNIIGGPYMAGNYWSDNPNPTDADHDGIGDTPYNIPGGINVDQGPLVNASTLSPLQVWTNKPFYTRGNTATTNTVAITIRNVGQQSVVFPNGFEVRIFGPTYVAGQHLAVWGQVWPNPICNNLYIPLAFCPTLSVGHSITMTWNMEDGMGQLVPYGDYEVETWANIADQNQAVASFTIRDIGYCIIIAGAHAGPPNWTLDDQPKIDEACNNVYKGLENVGFSPQRIYYLNTYDYPPWYQYGDPTSDGVSNWTTIGNLTYAFSDWAAKRVNETEPLFVFFKDHGCYEPTAADGSGSSFFSIDNPCKTGIDLWPYQLAEWLDDLQTHTSAPVYIVIEACHSGGFINQTERDNPKLSDPNYPNRVIITTAEWNEDSWFDPIDSGLYWEFFGNNFWPRVFDGQSLLSAFNSTLDSTGQVIPPSEEYPDHALLGDNGDGKGSMGPIRNPGPLMNGYLAQYVYLGYADPVVPQTQFIVARQSYSWPPPASVTLWAVVKNETSLTHVQALMLLPDWVPPSNSDIMLSPPLECFEMTDPNHDGNWTVSIPAINFTDHASGPSNFPFLIVATDANNATAFPLWTSVEFTANGQPTPDTLAPALDITRPNPGQVLQGTVTINGTAMDDVCLQKVEVYADKSLLGVISPPHASNSFFSVSFNTTAFPNGPTTIMVKAFDTSNNTSTQTIPVVIANPLHNIAITNAKPSKTIIGQGYFLSINVTSQNQDNQTQTFQVAVYANTTLITSQNVTVKGGNSINIIFKWNTAGSAYGNYTITVYATPVLGETDTTDNLYSCGTVKVTIPGDINGDGIVNILDYSIVAINWGSHVPPAPANADILDTGIINILDIGIIAAYWGQSIP